MAILKYVPPTKKIIDKRSADGGYYEAECEICSTKYYPERSNSKYCTPNCGLIAHRIAVANGTASKKYKPGGKVGQDSSRSGYAIKTPKNSVICKGKDEVIGWFHKQGLKTRGLGVLLKCEVGSMFEFGYVKVQRLTSIKYVILNP